MIGDFKNENSLHLVACSGVNINAFNLSSTNKYIVELFVSELGVLNFITNCRNLRRYLNKRCAAETKALAVEMLIVFVQHQDSD